MRVGSWLGAVLVVVTVTAGVVVAAVHARPHPESVAAAQRITTAGAVDTLPYPPSRLPRPTPSPAPAPSTKPSTAGSAPSHTTAAPGVSHPSPPRYYSVSAQQRLINQDRARYGLPPLAWSSCLESVAVANARRMAAQGYISHANGVYQDLACGLGNRSGENVGYYSLGVDDALLNTDFMNSPEHRANILGPYRYVATAWVVAPNGYGYIAVEFD